MADAIQKEMPVGRTATVTYINIKQASAQFVTLAGPQVQPVLDALGLNNVESLACGLASTTERSSRVRSFASMASPKASFALPPQSR